MYATQEAVNLFLLLHHKIRKKECRVKTLTLSHAFALLKITLSEGVLTQVSPSYKVKISSYSQDCNIGCVTRKYRLQFER